MKQLLGKLNGPTPEFVGRYSLNVKFDVWEDQDYNAMRLVGSFADKLSDPKKNDSFKFLDIKWKEYVS